MQVAIEAANIEAKERKLEQTRVAAGRMAAAAEHLRNAAIATAAMRQQAAKVQANRQEVGTAQKEVERLKGEAAAARMKAAEADEQAEYFESQGAYRHDAAWGHAVHYCTTAIYLKP